MRALGATQAEVAEITELTEPQVSHRMHGRSPWKLSELDALANAWGITLDELTGRKAAK